MTKLCNKCNEEKEVSAFYKGRGACRKCRSDYSKEWYKTPNGRKKQHEKARTPEGRFAYSKARARKRHKEWNIEQDLYFELIKQPCYYCTASMENVTGIGLDRLNNDIGYTATNVVSCCGACNSGKGDNYTSEEWKVMVTALIAFRNQI